MENNIKKEIIEVTANELKMDEYNILEVFEYKNYNLDNIKNKYMVLTENPENEGTYFSVKGHIIHVCSLEQFNQKLNLYVMDYIEIYSVNLSKFDYYGVNFVLDKNEIVEKYITSFNEDFNKILEVFENTEHSIIKKDLTVIFKDALFLVDILKNNSITQIGLGGQQIFKDINSDFAFNLEVLGSKYRQEINNIILSLKQLSGSKTKNNG